MKKNNDLPKDLDYDNCPIGSAIALIGGKWKLPVMYNLREGKKRFNELRRLLPGVTQKMLTHQLRELENDGLISRKVYAEVPPKVEYTLTLSARKLKPILALLCEWGLEHKKSQKLPEKIGKMA